MAFKGLLARDQNPFDVSFSNAYFKISKIVFSTVPFPVGKQYRTNTFYVTVDVYGDASIIDEKRQAVIDLKQYSGLTDAEIDAQDLRDTVEGLNEIIRKPITPVATINFEIPSELVKTGTNGLTEDLLKGKFYTWLRNQSEYASMQDVLEDGQSIETP